MRKTEPTTSERYRGRGTTLAYARIRYHTPLRHAIYWIHVSALRAQVWLARRSRRSAPGGGLSAHLLLVGHQAYVEAARVALLSFVATHDVETISIHADSNLRSAASSLARKLPKSLDVRVKTVAPEQSWQSVKLQILTHLVQGEVYFDADVRWNRRVLASEPSCYAVELAPAKFGKEVFPMINTSVVAPGHKADVLKRTSDGLLWREFVRRVAETGDRLWEQLAYSRLVAQSGVEMTPLRTSDDAESAPVVTSFMGATGRDPRDLRYQ